MGCWNQTCAISNLHIRAGQDVVVVTLERKNMMYEPSFCYTDALYRLTPIPFYATYNEYGGGENTTGIGRDVLFDHIKKILVEKDIGENQYHDIAVTKDEFDEELFFDACHEDRLFCKQPFGSEFKVDFVMIHKHIFDSILDNYIFKEYVGGENPYIKYKFDDIKADIPELVKQIKLFLNNQNIEDSYFLNISGIRYNELFKEKSNYAAMWMTDDDKSLIFGKNEILAYMIDNSEEDIINLITDMIKLQVINAFMSSVRKMWTPQSGQGSQSASHSGYRVLINAMTEVLDAERAEYDFYL